LLHFASRNCPLTWATEQKKADFTLEEDNTKMIVNYTSCWNEHFGTEWFTEGEIEIEIEIFCLSEGGIYLTIGLVNESFSGAQSCLGCQNCTNNFVLTQGGNANIAGTAHSTQVSFPGGKPQIVVIKANFNEKTICFANKEKGVFTQNFTINGTKWRVATSFCNSGTVNYKFLGCIKT